MYTDKDKGTSHPDISAVSAVQHAKPQAREGCSGNKSPEDEAAHKHLFLRCGEAEELQVGTQVTQVPVLEPLGGNKGIG